MSGNNQLFRVASPGDPIKAEQWNDIARAVSRQSQFGDRTSVISTGAGVFMRTEKRTRRLLGKTNASHAKGASGVINIYHGSTKGSEAATGATVTAYNRFASLSSNVWVFVEWIDGGWELYAAECA